MSSIPIAQFAAQMIAETLGRSTDVDACMQAVAQIDALLDQAASHLQSQGSALACCTGCHFCCYLTVRVLPHEAIALFRYLQSRMSASQAQQVRAQLHAHANRGGAALSPCAFLIDGTCSAYAVRPSACAAYHSLSRERCEESFRDPARPPGTVALHSLQVVALELEAGVRAALEAQGLSHAPVELHRAVFALLQDPALIARWRTGRPLMIASRGAS